MKKILYILPLLALAACGSEEEKTETKKPVKLETTKDKVSYSFGALDAQKVIESNPNGSRMDKKMLIEGYKDGFKADVSRDPNGPVMQSLNNLFGPQGMDFDTTFIKEGSRSYGMLTAAMFYESLSGVSELESIDKSLLFRGFEDGLYNNDTILTEQEQMKAIQEFSKKVQEKMMAEQQNKLTGIEISEAAEWEKIKAISGIQELQEGVYLKTIKKGSGEYPTATSDVEATYVLSDLKGKVIQRSSEFGQNFKTNLQGVVQGWTIGFQSMQKGGKYILYLPARMAYGEESLVFEIELFDIGPAGSIAPPRQ